MRNFAFSSDYMKAISDKVTQEQLRLGAENKLTTIEAEQKQKVAIAEAEAAALAQNKDLLELRRIEVERLKAERWDGKLPENIHASAPVPFRNVNK